MVIMELLLELLWCTIPAHAQSEKQYNFKEKVWKTTVQYTFYHSILLTWIYMHCLFKILSGLAFHSVGLLFRAVFSGSCHLVDQS